MNIRTYVHSLNILFYFIFYISSVSKISNELFIIIYQFLDSKLEKWLQNWLIIFLLL